MQLIKALYPKLRIVARGNVIKVLGDEEEMCAFEENITKLEKYCVEYNSLKEEVIIDIIKGNAPQAEKSGNVIVFSVTGKPIIPRSENQLKLVEAFAKNDMLFAIGPAGSGKTYTAIALAVRALKNKEIKKIILSRPAVELSLIHILRAIFILFLTQALLFDKEHAASIYGSYTGLVYLCLLYTSRCV